MAPSPAVRGSTGGCARRVGAREVVTVYALGERVRPVDHAGAKPAHGGPERHEAVAVGVLLGSGDATPAG